MLNCSILSNFVAQNTPRGIEHNSTNNDSNITYNSNPVKRWPESGTDSAKTPKIRPESQQVSNSKNTRKQAKGQVPELPDDLADIVEVWSTLPEHVRQAIVTLVASVTVTAREGDEVV